VPLKQKDFLLEQIKEENCGNRLTHFDQKMTLPQDIGNYSAYETLRYQYTGH